MKRFLVFGYDDYYPCGGWDDFDGCFDTLEDALEHVQSDGVDEWRRRADNREIVDMQSLSIVSRWSRTCREPDGSVMQDAAGKTLWTYRQDAT